VLVKGLVAVSVAVSTTYAFVKVLDTTKSFAKAVLAVSALADLYLVILWILGVDRPLFTIMFQRTGTGVTVTALTLFVPVKIAFTLWLWLRSRGARI